MYGYGNSMFLATHGILARTASGGGVDPDAQAFITAASITDSTQQSAINQLVVDLKGYSIWTKMKAIYPFVGASSSSFKYNLKDPRDLDAAYRLQFYGSLAYNSTGLISGLNGYADTRLSPSAVLSQNSIHLSFYSRTNNAQNTAEIGTSNNGGSPYLLVQTRSAGDKLVAHINDAGGSTQYTNTDGKGFYIGNRTASNVKTTFKNGTKVINDTYASSGIMSQNIYILAYNGTGGAQAYSLKECAFASIGEGLTDTEASNFNTAVQAFQTTLSRNV